MYCLDDVMNFFVSTVGPTARPLQAVVGSMKYVSTDAWSFAPEPDDARLRSQTHKGCHVITKYTIVYDFCFWWRFGLLVSINIVTVSGIRLVMGRVNIGVIE